MESMRDCDSWLTATRIRISSQAKQDSRLETVYKNLRNQRWCLEIVGVSSFYKGFCSEEVVMAKIIKKEPDMKVPSTK